MPAQGSEAALLRRKSGDSVTSLPDEDLDMLFEQAETDYVDYSRKVIFQAVLVERKRELLAVARKAVTYQLNETRENLSDIAKGLAEDLEKEEAKLAELISLEKPVALRTAVMKRIPTRIKGYPNG